MIILVWLELLALALTPMLSSIVRAEQQSILTGVLVLIGSIFIAYFWLNGTKDVIYTLYYYLILRKVSTVPKQGLWRERHATSQLPHVVMVYCTYNDFNADSLLASMNQDYSNYRTIILDDSTKEEYKRAVDEFAEAQHLLVIRRYDHIGFKAGNLNNYLSIANYDYFVILDSDEVIPPNFITRSLDYFAASSVTGIVQANHIATRNRNAFMKLFSIGVDSHWPTYQLVKNYHGFLSLLGHGAMVSRECYVAAGGFPDLVAEDLCFSIEARNKGYLVSFAPDILCEEEYPVDYLAFKKRHSKWTQGNMEFMKRYTGRIIHSHMTWFEKLDIVLFTYSLPLTAFFALYVVINVVLLPLMQYRLQYPTWLLIPTVIFLLAPMLNDILYYRGTIGFRKMAWYLVHTFLLYGSMFFVSLRTSITSTFGKSVFLVTPKDSSYVSWRDAFRANRSELIFACSLLCISVIIDKSPLPVLFLTVPSLTSVYMSRMANIKRAATSPWLRPLFRLRRRQAAQSMQSVTIPPSL